MGLGGGVAIPLVTAVFNNNALARVEFRLVIEIPSTIPQISK